MKKVYLIIDEPKACDTCRFSVRGECVAAGRSTDILAEKKPVWCPLNALPQPPEKVETNDADEFADEVVDTLRKAFQNVGQNENLWNEIGRRLKNLDKKEV